MVIIHHEEANSGRLFGHTMVCITCARSIRSVQRHAVERTDLIIQDLPMSHPAFHQAANYVCHPYWIRIQRQSNRDENQSTLPRREPVPQAEPESGPQAGSQPETASGLILESDINLPNYKRAANTSSHLPSYYKKML
ncbi:hypothetical protein HW555_010984 [Spodoptera exigua]|uniref:Uncharacterized protein n=1 Tax=Spodoptera exigua TaxID=7107 RepID=A0A835G9Y6_SPOEX|nr:hypothetical protein HW555_010984 [Spodoptera exigua]